MNFSADRGCEVGGVVSADASLCESAAGNGRGSIDALLPGLIRSPMVIKKPSAISGVRTQVMRGRGPLQRSRVLLAQASTGLTGKRRADGDDPGRHGSRSPSTGASLDRYANHFASPRKQGAWRAAAVQQCKADPCSGSSMSCCPVEPFRSIPTTGPRRCRSRPAPYGFAAWPRRCGARATAAMTGSVCGWALTVPGPAIPAARGMRRPRSR